MSRVGRKPITVPIGVTVLVDSGFVNVTGPKGSLSARLLPGLKLEQTDSTLNLTKVSDTSETQKSYGLMRTLVDNMVQGTSTGFTRQLEINGVGYRATLSGSILTLLLGFSHPINVALPDGIEAKVERNLLTISGHDKQLVGQVAANIRSLRKPEPYKGKGIKYIEERIRRKAGKTATKG